MKNFFWLSFLSLSALAWSQQKLGWSTGYYATWSGKPISRIPWKAYTHMCYFSLMPSGTSGALGGVSAAAAKAFVAEAHKNGVKAIICVGGDGTDGDFTAVTADATARAAMVKNIVKFVEDNGFDGVDMDWESKSESAGRVGIFKGFHQEIRTELDRLTPRRLLTAAVANWYPQCSASLYGIADQLNAMSYWSHVKDMDGFMSPIIKAGAPKKSLGVGMGFDTDGEVGNDVADCAAKIHYAIGGGWGGLMVWEAVGSNAEIQDSIAKYVDHGADNVRIFPKPPGNTLTLSIAGDGMPRYSANGAAFRMAAGRSGAYGFSWPVGRDKDAKKPPIGR